MSRKFLEIRFPYMNLQHTIQLADNNKSSLYHLNAKSESGCGSNSRFSFLYHARNKGFQKSLFIFPFYIKIKDQHHKGEIDLTVP